MSEPGCLKDVKAKYVEASNVLVEGDSSKLGTITLRDSGNNFTHLYVNKKDRNLTSSLVVSSDPPMATGTIEDPIVDWTYLNSMQPYLVPTHFGGTNGNGGTAFSKQGHSTPAGELDNGYEADRVLLLMLSNLRKTFPLELYNGVTWSNWADVSTLQVVVPTTIEDDASVEAGLQLKGDSNAGTTTSAFTLELTAGITTISPCLLKAGTDAGFIEATFFAKSWGLYDLVVIGFRQSPSDSLQSGTPTGGARTPNKDHNKYNAVNFANNTGGNGGANPTGDPIYSEFACFGVVGDGSLAPTGGGNIMSVANWKAAISYSATAKTTGTDASTATWCNSGVKAENGRSIVLRMELKSDGYVTYKYQVGELTISNGPPKVTEKPTFTTLTPDGSTVNAVQYKFPTGKLIVPFIRTHKHNATTTDDGLYLKSLKMGRLI